MSVLRRFLRRHDGAVAIEAALALAIVTLLTATTVELGHYLYTQQRLQNIAETVVNTVTREEQLFADDFARFFEPVPLVATPLRFTDAGVVIVSGMSDDLEDGARVRWQRIGGGNLTARSRIGRPPNDTPRLPVDFQLRSGAGRSLISAEVFFSYEPVFRMMMAPHVIYASAYMRPRVGLLDRLNRR